MPILSLDRIKLQATAADQADAIRQAGQLLVDSGCVLPEYVEGMQKRELSMSTCPGDYPIAIPHGLPENTDHILATGLSVLQLKQPVSWGEDGMVSLVFGIAAKGQEHLAVMETLTNVIMEDAQLEQLLTATDPGLVLGILGSPQAI